MTKDEFDVKTTDVTLSEKMKVILDALTQRIQARIYITNTKDNAVFFASRSMMEAVPQLVLGDTCFHAFHGLQAPCEDCPLEDMKKSDIKHLKVDKPMPPPSLYSTMDVTLVEDINGEEYGIFYCEEKWGEEAVSLEDFTGDISLYTALCKSTDDYIYMCDMKKNLFYFPPAMVKEFNLPGEIVEDAIPLWGSLIHESEIAAYFRDLNNMMSGHSNVHYQEYRVKNHSGKWIWVRCRGYLEHDAAGNPSLFAGIVTKLGKRSKIDHTSGLMNKYEFEKKINGHLVSEMESFGILLLGLDNFKYVNNLYGWGYGDEVIRISAQTILGLLPEGVELYRIEGDVFGCILPGITEAEIGLLYELIAAVFNRQQEHQGQRYYCTLSAGYALSSQDCNTYYSLFKRAEYALELSKNNGKNRLSCYNAEGMSDKDRSILIISCLRESVNNNLKNFQLYYQPQVSAKSQQVVSAEALLRWDCDSFGRVAPDEFVPLLEQTGLIHPVGRWVLETAAETCAKWRKIIPDFSISVNLSYLQLLETDLILFLQGLLKKWDLDVSALHVEVTESCIASGSRSLTDAFNKIREFGMHIEMDDFGTGYSSLEILKNEPADVVKIDRAFVKDITKSDFDATFIRFVVALCHAVNIKVCLEGIERWDEYELVREMDLDMIQGYLFGRPQTKEDFEKNYLN